METHLSPTLATPMRALSWPSCRLLPWLFLLLFCGLLFFHGLGDRDLLSSHEARAAQNAQMIISDGCWGLPQLFDRHLELQKPPLYYWLVALFGHLLGGHVNSWAVRLPAACSALGTVLFVLYMGKKTGRTLAGFLSALVLASCLHFTWLARVGRIDMPLTLAITVAAGSFYLGIGARGTGTRAWPWYLLGYVGIAAGILLKGPIALLLTGVIVGTFVISERWRGRQMDDLMGPKQAVGWRSSPGVSLVWGLPVVAMLAAPWFIWANIQTNNQVWEVFFWYHNFERGMGGSETLATHPFWFYLPRALVDTLPWSLAVPAAGWFFVRRVGWRHDREARLGAIWFCGVTAFLSCMSFKRADYLLPAYPGMAVFLGCCAGRFWQSLALEETRARKIARRSAYLVGALLASYLLGWGAYNSWATPVQERDWPYQKLAHDIRRQTDKPVIFFRAECHVLAFHVGRPLDTILEWENLAVWAAQPFPVMIVMPAECAGIGRCICRTAASRSSFELRSTPGESANGRWW